MRIYTLYSSYSGFSVKSVDYHGTTYKVAAESVKQAFFFAHNQKWSDGPDASAGIVEIYHRGGDKQGWHQLWCGCKIHGGLGIKNAMTKTALVKAMRSHECDD